MRDFIINEVYKVAVEQREFVKKHPLPKKSELDAEALKTGLQQSRDTCRQQETVFATPLMKNCLVVNGDVKQEYYVDKKTGQGEWRTEKLAVGAKSKAVDWINKVVNAALVKYNGPEKHEYNVDLDVFDRDHYNVDCWNGWKSEIWDIQPGQADERKKTFKAYADPKTNYTYEQAINDLLTDEELQTAIQMFYNLYPVTCASSEVKDVSDPFVHKNSGVSYPHYHNDASVVEGSDITYGQLCVNEVIEAYKRGPKYLISFAMKYIVATGYPRNQRGKGRALEAMSRIYNIIINMLESQEMEAVKQTPYATGLKNFEQIKKELIEMGEFCRKLGPEYGIYNIDGIQWDFNVGDGWNVLSQAVRKTRTNGTLGKIICDLRMRGLYNVWFVDGPNNTVRPIYGRMLSGYDDTTLGNSGVSRLACTAGAVATDRNYAKKVYYPTKGGSIKTLGDDMVLIFLKKQKQVFCDYLESKGIRLHNDDSKDAFGPFFIQYRVYIDENGNYVMGYNWPRVLRSMLSKENQKSLGKYGWTLAFYQQISKCLEIPTSLMILTNIAAALDKDHLSLNVPVSEIKHQVEIEDEAKRASQKGNRQKAMTTLEVITGGNPQARGITEDGKFDYDFFEEVQAAMRKVYNPHFLEDLGFKTPNLSNVK